jgi:hypothetical protein
METNAPPPPPTPPSGTDPLPSDPAAGKKIPAPITGAYKETPPKKNEFIIIKKGNRFLRMLKYFFFSFIILTILEIGIAYWLISSRWHLLLSNEEMVEYAERVKQAQPMPANFMGVYTAIFPNHVHTTLTQQIFINYGTRFLFRHTEIDDKPHCMCDMIYDIQKKRHQELEAVEWDGRLQDLEFGFGIEKYATPEQCFNYVMQFRVPELINQLNPKKYPHLKNKPVSEMNDEELIELILLLKSRWHYNREKNPARFEKAMVRYRERMKLHMSEQGQN